MRYESFFALLIGILFNVVTASSALPTTTINAKQAHRTQLHHTPDKKLKINQQQDNDSHTNEFLPSQQLYDSGDDGNAYQKQLLRHGQERPQVSLVVSTKYTSPTKENFRSNQEQRMTEDNSVTKLFSTPINEWSLEQFALFLVLIMFVFILLGCMCCGSCFGRGGGGGGNCLTDIIACYCCYECCCDDGPGIPYGVFA